LLRYVRAVLADVLVAMTGMIEPLSRVVKLPFM